MRYDVHQIVITDDDVTIVYSRPEDITAKTMSLTHLYIKKSAVNTQVTDIIDSANDAIAEALSATVPDTLEGDPLSALQAFTNSGLQMEDSK